MAFFVSTPGVTYRVLADQRGKLRGVELRHHVASEKETGYLLQKKIKIELSTFSV